MYNLNRALKEALDTGRELPMFKCLGTTFTYNQVRRLVNGFRVLLEERTDLKPGDHVGIMLPNLISNPIAVYACLLNGYVVVNFNPLYTESEIARQAKDAEIKAMIVYSEMAHKLEALDLPYVFEAAAGDFLPRMKSIVINVIKSFTTTNHGMNSIPMEKCLDYLDIIPYTFEAKDDALAMLQYTGGTTGVPKAAMLTQSNIGSNVHACHHRMTTEFDNKNWMKEVVLPLPLYHIYAIVVSLLVVRSRGMVHLIPNPRDIKGFTKTLSKSDPSAFIGIETLFKGLCANKKFKTLKFPSMGMTLSGGMGLDPKIKTLWENTTKSPVYEGYGLSETSPVICLDSGDEPHTGTVGFPVINTDVTFKDGELCVKGPQVMKGYWKRPDEDALVFDDKGWFHTGDIGEFDKLGRVIIKDRKKDMLIVSGFNVYPSELESMFMNHPDITGCAVVGDSKGRPVLYYEGAPCDSILKAMAEQRLAAYKRPKKYIHMEELPKSPVGKILKKDLR